MGKDGGCHGWLIEGRLLWRGYSGIWLIEGRLLWRGYSGIWLIEGRLLWRGYSGIAEGHSLVLLAVAAWA
jgi:hypothetical protein